MSGRRTRVKGRQRHVADWRYAQRPNRCRSAHPAIYSIGADETFSDTFAAAGIYKYCCSIHPRVTGRWWFDDRRALNRVRLVWPGAASRPRSQGRASRQAVQDSCHETCLVSETSLAFQPGAGVDVSLAPKWAVLDTGRLPRGPRDQRNDHARARRRRHRLQAVTRE